MGTKTKDWNGANNLTEYSLDEWERVIRVDKIGDAWAPNWSTEYGLDANGSAISVRKPNGITVTSEYDASNRIIKYTNGRGFVSEWGYDAPGQKGLLSWWQNGNGPLSRRTYIYNERDLIFQVTHPLGKTEHYSYDENGNVNAYKNGDDLVSGFSYDKRDLLTHIWRPQGFTQFNGRLYRDALGRVSYMTDVTGRTDYSYDAAGRLTSLATPRGRIDYSYDAANRMWHKTLQGVGSWQYYYDNGNRVYAMVNPYGEGTSFHYDGAGRVDYQIAGNGIWTTYNYDALSLLRDINHYKSNNPVAFSSNHYNYHASGMMSEAVVDGASTIYGYDDEDQLNREIRRYPNSANVQYDYEYGYDANGNRTFKALNGTLQELASYEYDDRLMSVNGPYGQKTFGYNGDGALTQVRLNGVVQATLGVDMDGRLLSYTPASGSGVTFQYNALGQRTFMQDYTGPYNYVADGATPGSPVLTDGKAVYSDGLSERRNGVSSFYQTDYLGSLGTMTNAGQNQTDGGTFDAWGMVTGRWGGNLTPYQWGGSGGYQRDHGTGLTLMGHRYYDASIGRFISRDPAKSGSNWYAYADNNPVNNMDPLGLQTAEGPVRPGTATLKGSGDLSGLFNSVDNFFKYDLLQYGRDDPRYKPRKNPGWLTIEGYTMYSPANVDIEANAGIAHDHFLNGFWFAGMVGEKNPWDFKKQDKSFANYGNFHYGYVGATAGFDLRILLIEAGRANIKDAGGKNKYGGWPGIIGFPLTARSPYGDDPVDQFWIT